MYGPKIGSGVCLVRLSSSKLVFFLLPLFTTPLSGAAFSPSKTWQLATQDTKHACKAEDSTTEEQRCPQWHRA